MARRLDPALVVAGIVPITLAVVLALTGIGSGSETATASATQGPPSPSIPGTSPDGTANPPSGLPPTASPVLPTAVPIQLPTVDGRPGVDWTPLERPGAWEDQDLTAIYVGDEGIVVAGSRPDPTQPLSAARLTLAANPPRQPPARAPAIWWSSDGLSWLDVSPSPAGARESAISDLVAVPGGIVAFGWYEDVDLNTRTVVWLSSDGRTWRMVETALPNTPLATLAIGDRVTAIVVLPMGGAPFEAWSTLDFASWTQGSLQAGGYPYPAGSLALEDGRVVLFGRASIRPIDHSWGGVPAFWTTRDGLGWNPVTEVAGLDGGVIRAVADDGTGLVAAGYADAADGGVSSDPTIGVWSGRDLGTWAAADLPKVPRAVYERFELVAVDDGIVLLATNAAGPDTVLRSDDGGAWDVIDDPRLPDGSMSRVVQVGDMLLALAFVYPDLAAGAPAGSSLWVAPAGIR
ncbi:MAG: hypothetical protein FIA92_05290 [Chloroflexi bacterium]|nr:hypothetical protein [Chloroflexota bacterium]